MSYIRRYFKFALVVLIVDLVVYFPWIQAYLSGNWDAPMSETVSGMGGFLWVWAGYLLVPVLTIPTLLAVFGLPILAFLGGFYSTARWIAK